MGSAATWDAEYTLERVLYMAIELDGNRCMLGFSTGLGQRETPAAQHRNQGHQNARAGRRWIRRRIGSAGRMEVD